MSRDLTKQIYQHVFPVKIHMSLRESLLGTFWMQKDAKFLYADNEDWSDCAVKQADMSLQCKHIPKDTFSHVAHRCMWHTLQEKGP